MQKLNEICEIQYKGLSTVLNTQTLKMIYQYTNVYTATGITKKGSMKTFKK